MSERCEKNEDLRDSVVAQVALREFLDPKYSLPDHKLFKAETQRVLMGSIADKLGKVPFNPMENDYLLSGIGDKLKISDHLIKLLTDGKYGDVDNNHYLKKIDISGDYYAPNFQTIHYNQPGGPKEMARNNRLIKLLNTSITDIRFDNPSSNDDKKCFSEGVCKVFKDAKIETLRDLIKIGSMGNLLKERNMGPKTQAEVEALFGHHNLSRDINAWDVDTITFDTYPQDLSSIGGEDQENSRIKNLLHEQIANLDVPNKLYRSFCNEYTDYATQGSIFQPFTLYNIFVDFYRPEGKKDLLGAFTGMMGSHNGGVSFGKESLKVFIEFLTKQGIHRPFDFEKYRKME